MGNVPKDVQRAWNIVADYLNKQQAGISFHIDPWNQENGKEERKYTLRNVSGSVKIVASSSWSN
ncbi:hypothetical protein JOD82_002044 [Paenibacillus sp. 1182]|uniref:hypothetical protein n=1 Tax=Paenibacillus sp. 1182 TaxID=2806565 RepID=UPI001AE20535|nr:hypothetical protein [Paenibacillus sp. 1182]MBP1309024.1 hypothetical protein [Paenibacillus sp. 1182]